MNALTGVFERLKPLRILWKYESGAEHARQAGVPDNVMVSPWLPQMEILGTTQDCSSRGIKTDAASKQLLHFFLFFFNLIQTSKGLRLTAG